MPFQTLAEVSGLPLANVVAVLDIISGGAKVLWVIFLVILPYLGVFSYLLTQGGSMAERTQAQVTKAREELRNIVGFSAADEIRKLDELKAKGSIADAEYQKLRARLI